MSVSTPTVPTRTAPGSSRVAEHLRIEEFPIHMPLGEPLWGRLYATSHRGAGRRFVVVNAAGEAVYDTEDCHDKANALNKLDHWLTDELYRRREPPLSDAFAETVQRVAADPDQLATPPYGVERLEACRGCAQQYPASFLKAGRCPECPGLAKGA